MFRVLRDSVLATQAIPAYRVPDFLDWLNETGSQTRDYCDLSVLFE